MGTFKDTQEKSPKIMGKALVGTVVFIVLFIIYKLTVANCISGYYQVIEPLSGQGKYETRIKSGRYFKGFNTVHTWEKSRTFWFSADPTEGSKEDQSMPVRYNDGGTANLSGSVRYTLGNSIDKLILLHIEFRNTPNFIDRAIKPLITETLTLTSTLIASEESYTIKKALFSQMALDQLNNGMYLTDVKYETAVTPHGEKKQNALVKIRQDAQGNFLRKPHTLKDFDIKFTQFVIHDPLYEGSINKRIKNKLENLMGKVTSIAKAEWEAEDKAKLQAEGKVKVVQAKYAQQKISVAQIVNQTRDKQKAEIEAQMRKEEAALKKEAADWQKKADILDGEGQSIYKELIKKADNNLDIRLQMWLAGHQAKAQAIADGSPLVPEIVLDQGKSASDRALEMINLEAAKRMLEKKE